MLLRLLPPLTRVLAPPLVSMVQAKPARFSVSSVSVILPRGRGSGVLGGVGGCGPGGSIPSTPRAAIHSWW